MRVEHMKSPYWEVDGAENGKVIFASRNSGCADFCAVPIEHLAKKLLSKGFYVSRDLEGHFTAMSNEQGFIDFNNK